MTHKQGDIIRLVYYAKVGDARNRELRDCQDLERGFGFNVNGEPLIESATSADQFEKTKKVSRTELIEIFNSVREHAFTVTFKKAKGELRVLRGYMLKPENGFGRSNVIDLDIEKVDSKNGHDNRMRQVDHRTLQSLVVEGVKYEVKK